MKAIWKCIYNIFKYIIRILHGIRTIIANIFCLLIFILISTAIYINLHDHQPLSKKTTLLLDLSGTIVDKPKEYSKYKKLSQYLLNINTSNTQEHSLFDVVNIIRQAKNDQNIIGLILLLKNFSGGDQTSLEYIGKVLYEFRNTGKLIYAISNNYNQSQYLLASYANKIYLTPQGAVDLKGLSTNNLYYKSLLDHLKINTHIFRAGTYKSAVEPFIRDSMSTQVRHEETRWINQLWQQYLKIISVNRNRTITQIFPGIDKTLDKLYHMKGDTSKYALENKLVDEVSPYFIIENNIKEIFEKNNKNTSFNTIDMYKYAITNKKLPQNNQNQIAVICINGAIIDGLDISGYSGSDTIIHKIRNARYNPKIKAIILRVNSPGGSVNASESIRLELIATRQSGKPIVASMGGIAASGGYWISTPANTIIASNSTLTGSIGVFGVINTFEKSLDTIGIHSDGVNTSPIANLSITKKLPIEYIKMMQLYVDTSYRYFIDTVAEFRGKTIESINNIAQGHVWLGCDALYNGLIDEIGDFDDAIKKAATLAHITKYQLNWQNDPINWITILLQNTDKIIHSLIFNIISYYTSLITTTNNINIINNNHDTFRFIWNDPKNCYALHLKHIQYN